MMDQDRLLDATEVSELLHVSERWVRDNTRSRVIPSVRLGRQVRYRRESIIAWVREQEGATSASTRRRQR